MANEKHSEILHIRHFVTLTDKGHICCRHKAFFSGTLDKTLLNIIYIIKRLANNPRPIVLESTAIKEMVVMYGSLWYFMLAFRQQVVLIHYWLLIVQILRTKFPIHRTYMIQRQQSLSLMIF